MTQTAQTFSRIPVVTFQSKPKEREASKALATNLLGRLQSCITWLLSNGINVIAFGGYSQASRDRLTVTVQACPQLYMLLGDDCAWHKRIYNGASTRFTWFAERFGVRIEWEETEWS